MNHRIDLLETHIKRLETKLVHEPQIDRWTDPKNAACRIITSRGENVQQFSMNPRYPHQSNINDYLLKPLPHYVSETNLAEFLTRHRHQYICPCYNCMLHDLFGTKGPSEVAPKPIMCPLDSDCTCMTFVHRKDFKHSIEVGIINGCDKELSKIQRYYASHTSKNGLMHVHDEYKGKHHDGTITYSIGGERPPYYHILNCIKRDGIDMFQYKKDDSGILYETADNLYVITDSYHYPPRDPTTFNTSDYYLTSSFILVPFEKYIADTNFLGKMPRKIKSRGFQKKRSTLKHHTPKR
jgi:hypothetical protein